MFRNIFHFFTTHLSKTPSFPSACFRCVGRLCYVSRDRPCDSLFFAYRGGKPPYSRPIRSIQPIWDPSSLDVSLKARRFFQKEGAKMTFIFSHKRSSLELYLWGRNAAANFSVCMCVCVCVEWLFKFKFGILIPTCAHITKWYIGSWQNCHSQQYYQKTWRHRGPLAVTNGVWIPITISL